MTKFTYIGPTQDFINVIGSDWHVENNNEYDINIEIDGPQLIINGIPQIHPDSTIWVQHENTAVPYNQECFEKHWSKINE